MPLTRERAEEIFKQVLKYSTADETEAMMGSTSYSLTRFANNTIHQNVLEEGSYLSVRAVAGQRTARASTNRFDDASIRQIAEAALELARTQPPNPDLLPMPAPQTYRAVNRFSQRMLSAWRPECFPRISLESGTPTDFGVMIS